jgi:hypothetical protein
MTSSPAPVWWRNERARGVGEKIELILISDKDECSEILLFYTGNEPHIQTNETIHLTRNIQYGCFRFARQR